MFEKSYWGEVSEVNDKIFAGHLEGIVRLYILVKLVVSVSIWYHITRCGLIIGVLHRIIRVIKSADKISSKNLLGGETGSA